MNQIELEKLFFTNKTSLIFKILKIKKKTLAKQEK
jgi:hypothetical protein